MKNNVDKDEEILIEFTDGRTAKILNIKNIDTEKIIQDLSKRLIDKQKELETYKKIAEKLVSYGESYGLDVDIDWARNEVEKDV